MQLKRGSRKGLSFKCHCGAIRGFGTGQESLAWSHLHFLGVPLAAVWGKA